MHNNNMFLQKHIVFMHKSMTFLQKHQKAHAPIREQLPKSAHLPDPTHAGTKYPVRGNPSLRLIVPATNTQTLRKNAGFQPVLAAFWDPARGNPSLQYRSERFPRTGYFVPACVGFGRWTDFERGSRIRVRILVFEL